MMPQNQIRNSTFPISHEVEKRASLQRLRGKRVGMVVFSLYPADPRPRRAVDALLKEGMAIDLICEGGARLPQHESQGDLDIFRIPVRHHRAGVLSYACEYSVFIFGSAAIFAWRTLRRRYDLIYVHNMPDFLIASALIPKWFGSKVILDQHDPMPELMMTIFGLDKQSVPVRIIRALEKWSIGRADLVVTVNEACRKIFSARSCRPEKVAVVMNSPDGDIFSYRPARSYPTRRIDQPFVIMYHGSLVERNGVGLAVDALALVVKKIPAAELRIFGRPSPYLDSVMEKVKRLALEDHVQYLGLRTLEELVSEIQLSDVGVIPNQRNIFTDINTPTRLFEYLSLGKPVIAPRTPGILDYFAPEHLFFFASGNADELAEQFVYVATHPMEAVETAERAQHVYLSHTWVQEREGLVGRVNALLHPRDLHST